MRRSLLALALALLVSPALAQRPLPKVSALSSSSVVVSTSSGALANANITIGAASGWIMMFDAVSLPANGATNVTPGGGALIFCMPVLSNGTTGGASWSWGMAPVIFNQGLVIAFSSTTCTTLTAATATFISGQPYQ